MPARTRVVDRYALPLARHHRQAELVSGPFSLSDQIISDKTTPSSVGLVPVMRLQRQAPAQSRVR